MDVVNDFSAISLLASNTQSLSDADEKEDGKQKHLLKVIYVQIDAC